MPICPSRLPVAAISRTIAVCRKWRSSLIIEVGSRFSSAPMRALLAREMAALAPILSGIYGNAGLILHPAGATVGLPPHRLATTVELGVSADGSLSGDLRCLASGLPFVNESFKLVVAQHALERIADPDSCAAEFARVLAPDGLALVLGFNPLGTWRPWLMRHARDLHLRSAQMWRARLAREGIDTLDVRFPGVLWPQADAASTQRTLDRLLGRFASSWLLVASKRRSALTPLRPRAKREPARAATLASGAHRECA